MLQHTTDVSSLEHSTTSRIRSLDYLETLPLCKTFNIFTPTPSEIRQLIQGAMAEIPFKATIEVIQRVAADNPDCFWAFRRANRTYGSKLRGFVAFLMLNEEGYDALLSGRLDTGNPSREYLMGQHEQPKAIYAWAIQAKAASPAVALIMEKLQSPMYRSADIYCRATTKEAVAFFTSIGFTKITAPSGDEFFVYRREHGRPQPNLKIENIKALSKNTSPKNKSNLPEIRVSTVQSFEQFMQAVTVRSAVYVGEERCPYSEEFDKNDFCGSHIIAYFGDEPVGCLRIRYFAQFAKFERLAVRSEYRGLGVAEDIIEYAKRICELKGFKTLCAHSRTDKVGFWAHYGFKRSSRPSFIFSDYSYVEMIAKLDSDSLQIGIDAEPGTMLRPEGSWDHACLLENSASRGVRV